MKLSLGKRINYWQVICFLCVFPFTAFLHHVVFFRGKCILNDFSVRDYSPLFVRRWLSHDLSLPIAIILALIIYYTGKRYNFVQKLIYPVPFSFLIYSIYVWDIPFTQRIICRRFHDGHCVWFKDIVLNGSHILFCSLFVYFITIFLILAKEIAKKGEV